jgi:hypothetical protein
MFWCNLKPTVRSARLWLVEGLRIELKLLMRRSTVLSSPLAPAEFTRFELPLIERPRFSESQTQHGAVAVENLALRRQLAALKRSAGTHCASEPWPRGSIDRVHTPGVPEPSHFATTTAIASSSLKSRNSAARSSTDLTVWLESAHRAM